MAKLTNFKPQVVEFPTHYEITETTRGNANIKNIVPAFGTITEEGTPETSPIYNGLQLGNVHSVNATKTTELSVDYYVCEIDGLDDFGLYNDLKIKMTVNQGNMNNTTKLRLNNKDFIILKEENGELKPILSGDFEDMSTYELRYNGSQFIATNVMSKNLRYLGIEYGGLLSTIGTKETTKAYWDNILNQMVVPSEKNNLTYFDAGKFLPISDYQNANRLENLYKVQQAKLYVHAEATGIARTSCNIVQRIGNIVTIIFDSGNALSGINDGTVIFQVPDGFKPKTFLSVNASQYNVSNGAVYIEPSGIGKWKGATVNSASIIFSVSYIV